MANVTITANGTVQVIKIGEVITGPQGPQGVQGEPGKPLRYEDLTPTQKAELKGPTGPVGPKGDPGTTDYNQLTNKPNLALKADVSYVDARYATLNTSKADKHYVDSQDTVLSKMINEGLQGKVNRAGDTMSGHLIVPSITVGTTSITTGAGQPNGVVNTVKGSLYIDTEITCGALLWYKTGTGNTSWKVLSGDTGWRDITPNPLPANIDKTNCKIRRINNVVEVAIGYTNVINATETVYTNSLPLGFRPAQNVFVTGTSTGPGTSRTGGVAIDETRIRWQSTVGNWRTAYARYTTDDAWPATLPGA